MRPYSPALLERAWAPDPSARPVIEAVALTLGAGGAPQQDARFTPAQWNAADSVAGLEIDAFGGVRLADAIQVWIQSNTSNAFISDLDGPISFPQASPYFAALLDWGADGSPDLVIDRVTANLHPQVNGANPKTVDTWFCQLFAIHGAYPYNVSTPAIGGSVHEFLASLVPLGPAIGVKALGNAQGDVLFSWIGQPNKPRPKSVASNTGPVSDVDAQYPWPRTLIVIWAVQADGSPATNVGWAVDTTLTSLTQGTRVLRGTGLYDFGLAIGGPGGGKGYLLDPVGGVANPVPRMKIETGSFVAAKIQFSGVGNRLTLPQVPVNTVEFQCEADVPAGATCVFEALKDGGNPANDPDWLAIADGMQVGDPSLGGLITKRAFYQIRARLLPSGTGDTTPTVRALGVRELTITDASSVARITNVRWAVDPPTLKPEIPQAQLVAIRDGDRDFQDLFTSLLAGNDIGNLLIRTWLGDSHLPRSQWCHIDDFLIDDTDPGGATISLTLLSTLALLRGAIPQYTPAVLAPPTADVSNPGGFTNESGGGTLWSHIDETVPDDQDYLQSPLHPAAAECEVAVQAIADPHLSTCHEVDIRYGKDAAGGDNIDITVQLRQGAVVIASQLFQNVGAGFTLGKLALTAAQADAITDYTNLRLHFIANVNGGGGGNRRGRVSYGLFQITARRTPVVYNNQSPAAIASDLLANQIELPGRFLGGTLADTTTLLSKTIADSDAKNELDAVAYAAGQFFHSSQGRVKAADLVGGSWSPDPTPVWTFNPTAIAALIPSEEIEPIDVTPGYRQRVPQFFAKWGWDPVAGKYAAEVRGFNTDALNALGEAQLDPPQELDDLVAQYLQTAAQAQAIAQRQVVTLGAGMILFRFRTTYGRFMLELGDTIAFQTDRFAAKDPSAVRAVRGQLWVVGKLVEIGDFDHRTLGVWVRNYSDLLGASEAANRIGFGAPVVLAVNGTVDSLGNVNVAVTAAGAKGIKVAASTAGPPSRATIEAAAPVVLTADGLATINAILTPLLAGQTAYIGVLAYENSDGSGAESADIGVAVVVSPATPYNGILSVRLSWQANQLMVNVEGGPGTLSFKIATSTVGYPLAGTGTVTNGSNGNVASGTFVYGQTVYVTVTPYTAIGGGGVAGPANGGQTTLPYSDGLIQLGTGHMLRSSSFDDGKFAVVAAVSDGSQVDRSVKIAGANRTAVQMLTEIAPNAEFDIWESASQAHAWANDLTAGATVAQETTPASVYSGDYALKYSNPDNATNGGWHGVSSNDLVKGAFCLPLRGGLTYRIKIASKTSRIAGGQKYRLVLSFNAAETLQASQSFVYAAVGVYQVDTWVVSVPAAAEPNSKLYIQFSRNGDATATDFWVDSLRWVEDTPAAADVASAASGAGTNLIQNPDFEQGVSYWRQTSGGSLDSETATPIAGAKDGIVLSVASTTHRVQQCDRASDLSGSQNPGGGVPLYVPVSGADEIYGSIAFKCNTGAAGTWQFGVEEYDATKTLIQRTYLSSAATVNGSLTLRGGVTLQATTAYIVPIIEVVASVGGGGITHHFDTFRLYRVSPPKLRVKAGLNAAVVLGTGVATTVAWNLNPDSFDVGAMHDPTGVAQAASKIIVPAAAVGYGAVHVHAQLEFAANAAGIRKAQIKKNGATVIAEDIRPAVNGDVTTLDCSTIDHHPAAGDYYEVIVTQTSGGNLNLDSAIGVSFFEAHQLV